MVDIVLSSDNILRLTLLGVLLMAPVVDAAMRENSYGVSL